MASPLEGSLRIPISWLIMIFLFTHCANSQAQNLIDKICHQTEDYSKCNTIFHKILPSPSTEIHGLVRVTIDHALNTANDIKSLVEETGTANPGLRDALSPCLRAYEQLTEAYQAASKAFDQKDYLSVVVLEQDTPRSVDACTPPPRPPSLADRNREMKFFLTTAVATSKMLVS